MPFFFFGDAKTTTLDLFMLSSQSHKHQNGAIVMELCRRHSFVARLGPSFPRARTGPLGYGSRYLSLSRGRPGLVVPVRRVQYREVDCEPCVWPRRSAS
jgi:hypothetical protein